MPEGHSPIESPVRRGRRLRRLLVLVSLTALAATGIISGRAALSGRTAEGTPGQFAEARALAGTTMAKRGPLELVLTQRGALDCVQKTTLASKVEWETKLTFLLPEGEFVKKGDLIAKLDVAKLQEEYGDEQVDVMTAETALAAAEDALILQRIENENALAAAKLSEELTALSLTGYDEAEYPFQVNDLERQIAAAKDALHTAREKVAFTERLLDKGFRQKVELDRDRLAFSKAEQTHADLVESLRVLENHNYKRTLRALEGDARTAKSNLTRTESLAETRLLIRGMQIDSQKRRLLRQTQQFEWATRMLKECEIRAPHDGQVVYVENPYTREPVSEGISVRFLQPICTIPDRSRMKVTVRVHETQRRLLNLGLPAEIRTDADPRRAIRGTVASISQFPVSGRYPNYDLREYEVVVHLDEREQDLTPGLTTKVNLIAASKTDALQVPFEAVTEVDDSYLVFVRDGEQIDAREVTLGERSEDHVEVLAGLDEGELVVLDPRQRCYDAIVAWENSREDVLQTATALGE